MSSLDTLWQRFCADLSQQVSPEAVRRWFEPLRLKRIQDDCLYLEASNSIFQYWIEENYLPQLQQAARRILGKPCHFAFESSEGNPAQEGLVETPLAPTPEETTAGGLNPRHTFETFVVGPNNEFAAAASRAVAQAPARTYNPLFIHGRVGLGKTHLMQAIGNFLKNSKKGCTVRYVTSEQFTNDFIHAIQHAQLSRFRRHYRKVDVLLIDDIQFLAGKERSQEEFFHTFNTLFDSRKQIVVTSDAPPSALHNLERRLTSRFEWGLTTEILPPGVETRIAILRKKLELMGTSLPDELIAFIAERIRTNVRRLEGALTRVSAYTTLHGGHVSLSQVENLLRDLLSDESPSTPTIPQIQRLVAESFDVRLADLTSRRRPTAIVLPRMVAMYLCRRLTAASLSEIGEAFGGRDHGTVLHAQRTIAERMEVDPALRKMIEELLQRLGGS